METPDDWIAVRCVGGQLARDRRTTRGGHSAKPPNTTHARKKTSNGNDTTAEPTTPNKAATNSLSVVPSRDKRREEKPADFARVGNHLRSTNARQNPPERAELAARPPPNAAADTAARRTERPDQTDYEPTAHLSKGFRQTGYEKNCRISPAPKIEENGIIP